MATDNPGNRLLHPDFTTIAPPSQLPTGKEPGTYYLSSTCMVDFSLEPDFPTRIVLLDYANQQLFEQKVTSRKPFTLNYDLKPGSYKAVSRPVDASKYRDAIGFNIHIDLHGAVTYLAGDHSFESPTFWHIHKIEIVSPKNLETIQAKTIQIGQGPSAEDVIPGGVTLRWKPLPGIKSYIVRVWYMDNPLHPDSAFGDWDAGGESHSDHLTLNKTSYLHLKTGYTWAVSDEPDADAGYYDGHLAFGKSIFLTPGAREALDHESDTTAAFDTWIDTKLKIQFEQYPWVSDGPGYVFIKAVGCDSPAIKAGLHPDLQIFSVNGTRIETLDELKARLAKTAPGAQVEFEVGDPEKKWKFKLPVN
ncbi:MAG: PDZ domain-containing protein [Methylacidiphilales bacterium]|nr:PDZ domain-containing protein [Candidatus Methylacidiphilales bacterium]